MVCYMMSILTRHNAAEYSVHWDWLFDSYTTLEWDNDVNNFIDYYPGNTCDYSSGLVDGWKMSMNNFVQKEFGIDALPPDKIANMYGFCNQH